MKGIPTDDPPDDGALVKYEILHDENSITTYPTVDISYFTAGDIYAAPAAGKETHRFIGWVTGSGAGVITDYTQDAALDRYADLTIYTTAERAEKLTEEGFAPINGGFAVLADNLTEMPDGGANYYAVWEPCRAEYVVQLWFEDADQENLYVLSHSLDFVRSANIGDTVSYTDFDVLRADEAPVIAATQAEDGFPYTIKDPDSGVEDSYTSYESSYVHSPFYGFDLLKCECGEDCACTTGGTCDCPVCQAMTLSHPDTTGNKCNCQGVTVGNDGKTVLSVFYTRETWKIVYHPTVEMAAYKDYPIVSGTQSAMESIIGRFAHHILFDKANEDPTLPETYTYEGKYGMPISQGHQVGSAAPLGAGYTGVDYSQWEAIAQAFSDGGDNPGQTNVGTYANLYLNNFLGVGSREGLYFNTEPHNANYYQSPEGTFNSAKLGFSGVSEIQPSVFMEYANKGGDIDPATGTAPETVTMQRYTGVWKGERFERESSYNLADGSYTYGTHTMHLYPFYGNVDNTYIINYYGEALPSDPDSECLSITRNDVTTRYKLVKVDTVVSPSDSLFYDATIPSGYTAQMWRTSIRTNFTANSNSFRGNLVTNAVSQSSVRKPWSITPTANPMSGNYANYQNTLIESNNSYRAYLPTWEVWQGSSKVGNILPDGYWITDWIRVVGNAGTMANMTPELEARLQSTVRIGALFPQVTANHWGTRGTNAFFYPGKAGESRYPNAVTASTNAIALTRNRYSITYNSVFIGSDGKLVTDDNGDIVVQPLITTNDAAGKPEILFEQRLDGTGNAKNYYNAYFAYDSATKEFTHLGYTAPESLEEGKTLIGGEGKWYLDPDGTIEFDETTMLSMPSRNLDVYYVLSDVKYNVVFVDKLTGTRHLDVSINGEVQSLDHVLNYQTVMPNTTALPVPDPVHDQYLFAGWFLDEEGEIPFSFDQEITGDTIVYALWKPKVPVNYTINHILEYPDGRLEVLDESETVLGYVGQTVDARALSENYYANGMYFEPDDYSKTMVLTENAEENVLNFIYHYAERTFIIRYREDGNEDNLVAPDLVVTTKLLYVTARYKNFEDWGWHLTSEPVVSCPVRDGEPAVITFLYERLPGPTLELEALKWLNDESFTGERFNFILTNANGGQKELTAVDGKINYSLYFDAPGEYSFHLTEVDEGQLGVKYDHSDFEIRVRVYEDKKTNLRIQDVRYFLNGQPYMEAAEPQFRNYERLDIERLGVEIPKYLNDEFFTGERFSFALTDAKGKVQTLKAVDGKVNFTLGFDQPGEYVYDLVEIDEGEFGVKYDKSAYQIRVTVSEDDKAVLHIDKVEYLLNGAPYTEENMTFENKEAPKSEDSVSTGDTSHLMLWLTLLLATGTGAVLILCVSRKQSKKGKHDR